MTSVDLVDRISTAPRSSLSGPGYRQLAPKYDPLSGEGARIHGGRFNAPESFPVLYLCSTPGCAAAEFMRYTEQHPLGPTGFVPRALYRYNVSLTSVLDLADDQTLEHLGVESAQLVDDKRSRNTSVNSPTNPDTRQFSTPPRQVSTPSSRS
jgi:RES domain-containing protein